AAGGRQLRGRTRPGVARAEMQRRMAVPAGYQFTATVGRLGLGRYDPCARFIDGRYWWATRTPDGPASLSLHRDGGELVATAYGSGAEWLLARADAIAG